ncbi:unnamed protein product [Angiostrongylus costaricensis]|uniref:TIL domain-containing protein n=1 Tax=Angiostrongylus costaricensis TaxID=334426 RepID=A0A0R3P9D6_ANGCS|nr:unnamed protein product [Angiostrongylus costaricensis]
MASVYWIRVQGGLKHMENLQTSDSSCKGADFAQDKAAKKCEIVIARCYEVFRCPADQSCRLGECRIMEGLPCVEECSGPFLCIDGRCRRNDCERRVCQLGESCENGHCTRVVGRFCTWAPRDCGVAFACNDHFCVDQLTPATTAGQPQHDNTRPS